MIYILTKCKNCISWSHICSTVCGFRYKYSLYKLAPIAKRIQHQLSECTHGKCERVPTRFVSFEEFF